MEKLILIFIAASITNNFVLTYFLGICPFIGVSNKIDSSIGLGIATTFVMTMAATFTWLIYKHKDYTGNYPDKCQSDYHL